MKEREERKTVYMLLMAAAGMMGAYTYVLRGGVFCNAQTGNMLKMGMKAGQGHWLEAAYYLVPMAAYMGGCYVSEVLRKAMSRHRRIWWSPLLVGCEMGAFLLIGCIPLTVPDQMVQVMVNFIAAMQYNTFRQARGIPLVTTVCTSHIRALGTGLAHLDRDQIHQTLVHLGMVASFVCGAAVLTGFRYVGERACWLLLLPLGLSLILLLEEEFSFHPLHHFHHIGV